MQLPVEVMSWQIMGVSCFTLELIFSHSFCVKQEKEARHAEHTATRDSSLFRLPLASVQKIASAACCVSKKKCNKNKPSTPHSRHIAFNEVSLCGGGIPLLA